MGEIQTNLRTYQVDYACDACKEGFMVSEMMFPSNPPKYRHRCTNIKCQHTETFSKSYPLIEYEPSTIPADDEQFPLIKVDGYVEKSDDSLLGEEEFWEAFIDFIESRGWLFGGLIRGATDEEAAAEIKADREEESS